MMDWLADGDEGDEDNSSTLATFSPWKVVIVDDDKEIHKVTKLSLDSFIFEGRALKFISLYSGEEAKTYFDQHKDIAIVLLDVVMESDDAGLSVANYIRNTLNNSFTRILLRTGQPGLAPEHSMLSTYDIDGYIAKTASTLHILQQSLYVALRSYRDLLRLQSYQHGLEIIIASMAHMHRVTDILELSKGVMTQIASLSQSQNSHLSVTAMNALTVGHTTSKSWNIVIEGAQARFIGEPELAKEKSAMSEFSDKVLQAKQHLIEPPLYGYYSCSEQHTESVFILESAKQLSNTTTKLLKLFVTNIVLAMEYIVSKH